MGTLTLRHGDRRWVCKELWTKQEFGQSIYSKKAGPTCTNANGGSPESLATQVTHMHSWKHPFFRRAPLLDAVVDPFQLKKPSSSSCPFVLSPFRKICLKNVCEQGPRISQGCSLFSHLMTADLFSPVEACRKVDSTHLINLRKLLRASRTLLNSIASVCLPNSQSINQSISFSDINSPQHLRFMHSNWIWLSFSRKKVLFCMYWTSVNSFMVGRFIHWSTHCGRICNEGVVSCWSSRVMRNDTRN